MPLLYTPDRELVPPDSKDDEVENTTVRCEVCFDRYRLSQLTFHPRTKLMLCDYCINQLNNPE